MILSNPTGCKCLVIKLILNHFKQLWTNIFPKVVHPHIQQDQLAQVQSVETMRKGVSNFLRVLPVSYEQRFWRTAFLAVSLSVSRGYKITVIIASFLNQLHLWVIVLVNTVSKFVRWTSQLSSDLRNIDGLFLGSSVLWQGNLSWMQ